MTKQILIFILDENNDPATGLVPKIKIRDLGTGMLVVNNMSMVDVQDGFYKYAFTAFDYTKDYSILIDTTLTGSRKWRASGIESQAEEVADAVGENLGSEVVDAIADEVTQAVDETIEEAVETGMTDTVTNAVQEGIAATMGGPSADF